MDDLDNASREIQWFLGVWDIGKVIVGAVRRSGLRKTFDRAKRFDYPETPVGGT
jgi:hypothetical protein